MGGEGWGEGASPLARPLFCAILFMTDNALINNCWDVNVDTVRWHGCMAVNNMVVIDKFKDYPSKVVIFATSQ